MNKTAIKNFAIQARNKLIADVCYRAGLVGITEKGIQAALPQSDSTTEFYDIGIATPYAVSGQAAIRQRRNLAEAIRRRAADSDYPTAYRCIMEEVAYTWFNRLIAVRFMEVNDYLPGRVRVLSSESGKIEPDLVTNPFDAELSFTAEEEQTILQLKQDNKLDELFRLLFIKQCNALAAVLPALFEQTEDYTELLLNLSVVDQEGVVWHLTHDIPEDDFNVEKGGQVEIIGWLYQYYNTEPKAQVFARPSGQKIKKEEIPAATQLFTPDWIVRYMVENSLGRVVINNLSYDIWADEEKEKIGRLKARWKYYLDEAPQTSEVDTELRIMEHNKYASDEVQPFIDTTLIDPCMGSGHILVYAFDVFMDIYKEQGWNPRDAAQRIVQKNLYGLDIDKRAWQMAYFAVMMKARQYDRRFFTRGIQPKVYYPGGDKELEEFGSLVLVDDPGEMPEDPQSMFDLADYEDRLNAWSFRYLLAQKYDVVVTNPPYMAVSNASGKLQEYVKKNFPDSKADLFAVFIERCGQLAGKNGYQAMITQHAWMFLSSFENLRAKLQAVDTVNMAHLGARAFEEIGGEVVQTTSFVMRKSHIKDYKGTYCRLIEPNTQQGKEDMFLAEENRYIAQQDNFLKIPGAPVAYWVSDNFIHIFESGTFLSDSGIARQGLGTSDNNRFLRFWFEVAVSSIGFHCKDCSDTISCKEIWFPYIKGGAFRRWYPNKEYVVNYSGDGFEIKASVMRKYPYLKNPDFVVKNTSTYFHKGITWSDVATGKFSARWVDDGYIYADAGPMYFTSLDEQVKLGYFNSIVFQLFCDLICQGMHYSTGQIPQIPYLDNSPKEDKKKISSLVQKSLSLSKNDWDAFETSWDFTRHPLVEYRHSVSKAEINPDWSNLSYYLKNAYEAWEYQCQLRFDTLKANEEELNRIFIDIYGLQDELTPEVEDKDVTVRRADLGRDIRSLISYAVGCMFGRYSPYKEGLIYAGGEWDYNQYENMAWLAEGKPDVMEFHKAGTHFFPDQDNIIPICDEEYFADDIVDQFIEFIAVVYGQSTLEENIKFIADALGGKGATLKEVIRNYFLKDFFADHCKIYQKRPIYWLFDSGKQNGFKALVYLHRYTPDTIGKLRVDYLHRLQRVYASEIERMQDMIDNSKNQREVTASTKRKEKLQKQLKECREYDEKIAHLALARIELDLDDGVKVNYRKLQTASDGKLYEVLADSKNIMGKK